MSDTEKVSLEEAADSDSIGYFDITGDFATNKSSGEPPTEEEE